MAAKAQTANWYEQFFQGMALDLWRAAIPIEKTEEELAFLLETLAAPQGGRLLDVPCGNGRLSLPLALSGYKVTGIDFCQPFLNQATQSARAHKTKIDYIQGDMRTLKLKNKFEGAFCMGNSFGYFDRPGTIDFLKAVSACLESKARLVIDSAMVAECFIVNGGEKEWLQVGDMYMLVENNYDCRKSVVESTYTFIRGAEKQVSTAMHWIYTSGELCDILASAGFSVVDMLANADVENPEPFALGSERLLLVAEKA